MSAPEGTSSFVLSKLSGIEPIPPATKLVDVASILRDPVEKFKVSRIWDPRVDRYVTEISSKPFPTLLVGSRNSQTQGDLL